MSGRKRKSKYDAYFTISENSAICKDCNTEFAYSVGTSTNSLLFHLKKKHEDIYKKFSNEGEVTDSTVKNNKLEPVPNFFLPSTCEAPSTSKKDLSQPKITDEFKKWDSQGLMTAKVENAIGCLIAVGHQPLSIVNDPSFRNLLTVAIPNFKLKDRKYFTNDVVERIYEQMFNRVKEEINNVQFISLTMDGWSSTCNIHSLLAITGHWIDTNFQPKYAILGAEPIIGRHTDEKNFQEVSQEGKLNSIDLVEEEPNNAFTQFLQARGAKYLEDRMCPSPGSITSNNENSARQECEWFLSEKVTLSRDPHAFWGHEENAKKFPTLFKMAKKYLSPPATSSESERVFSAAGLITTEKRTNLTDDHLKKLLFTNLNVKIFGYPT